MAIALAIAIAIAMAYVKGKSQRPGFEAMRAQDGAVGAGGGEVEGREVP
jgi:hypothetical protein